MNIKQEIIALKEELIALRRDFHAHPELGLQEHRTADIIAAYLNELGLEVRRCTATGVIGLLRGGRAGRTVMLRSDIDALPIQEQTGLPFASQNQGVMHACGHDGHIAMLLITAKILTRHQEQLCGSVLFLFQPNEEDAGAQLMIDAGALENPSPEAVLGLHLWTQFASGTIAISPGPIMASSYYFKIIITGRGGHGGVPHMAVNPIDAAGHVLQAINSFCALEVDSRKPTVISVCKIHGGNKEIIVPDSVELEGSIRCLHSEDAAVRRRFAELVEATCKAHRCTCRVEYQCGNTLLNNDQQLTALAIRAAEQVVGQEHILTKDVSIMVGDDFAEFANQVPGVYYFVGTGNTAKKTDYEHHCPLFDIDEDSLLIGVEMQIRLVVDFLNRAAE